jgi:hypothetical protein
MFAHRAYLGEFELMVLLVVVRLGDEAYGVPISKELQTVTGREASLGSVYAALDRLEIHEMASPGSGALCSKACEGPALNQTATISDV